MKSKKFKLLKMLGLVLGLFSIPAYAGIEPGYFSSNDVDVFVQTQSNEDVTYAYGLLLNNKSGAIYRIEELQDGTQVWLRLTQGEGHFLKVNEDYAPEFKAQLRVNRKNRKELVLTPLEARTKCNSSEIIAEESENRKWIAFPDITTIYKGNDSEINSDNDMMSGKLVLNSKIHTGNFKLQTLSTGLATIRESTISQTTISGWALKREILGYAVSVVKKGSIGFLKSGFKEELFVFPLDVGTQTGCFENAQVFKGRIFKE